MTSSDRIRVYVAGARTAPITHESLVALIRNPNVELVGLDLDRIDPARLRDAAPDLLLSAAHESLIRPAELAVPRYGTVGLHPSLLPRYRGSHPLWWALHNREEEAGISLYVLDAGVDTGPILAQRHVGIVDGDTFASLYRRTVTHVAPLLDDLIDTICRTGAMPEATAQDESQATYFGPPSQRDLDGALAPRLRARLLRLVGAGRRTANSGS